MAFFNWLSYYSTGNKEIDDQHKKLIELVNKSYDAFSESKPQNTIKEIVNELINYTDYHFKSEEEIIIKYNYPKTKEHIEEHQNFIKQVLSFKEQIDKKTDVFNVEIFSFLRDWVHNHIAKTDKDYAKYFKKTRNSDFFL